MRLQLIKLIPLFPNFKNLELNDKKYFEEVTKKFEPYSDYNFISLWSYDIENDTKISMLNGNLVLKFRDYITNQPFYSFIGNNVVGNTIGDLLKITQKEGLKKELKLIPEVAIKELSSFKKIKIVEDMDNFDYILSIDELADLKGDKYHTHKNFVNRFCKAYNSICIKDLNLTDPLIHNQILELFHVWETKRNKERKDTDHELKAIKKLLRNANEFNLITLGVYDNKILVGFITASLEQMDYVISHFAKADPSYSGIFYFMYHNLAKALKGKGYKYLNNEQDLGIPGLRKSKKQWNPTKYLKKYTISK